MHDLDKSTETLVKSTTITHPGYVCGTSDIILISMYMNAQLAHASQRMSYNVMGVPRRFVGTTLISRTATVAINDYAMHAAISTHANNVVLIYVIDARDNIQ